MCIVQPSHSTRFDGKEEPSDMNEPLVSIVVPVYNAAPHLAHCIRSILRQRYENLEILLVDDGSDDVSLPICDMYARTDRRITVLKKPNSGVSATRNLAIGAAHGKYLQFADSDDWLDPNATRLLVERAEETAPELPLDGCAGKIVSGFAWRYVGLCSAKEGEKLLGDNGKPLTRSVKIKFPGQMETPLKASVSEVSIDEATGLARFVITCEIINGDVLRLNRAGAQIIVGETTGLRVPIDAIHYLKEDGTESETQGENYIPGVYVKYGNLARFCKIDPVDNDHPLVTDGEYRIVMPSSSDKTKTVSEVRLYDEIIVSGQNLYDGKLL